MIADKRKLGRVHPAYWWGMGIYVATFAGSMLLAYSPIGYAVTEWVVAGTPGRSARWTRSCRPASRCSGTPSPSRPFGL